MTIVKTILSFLGRALLRAALDKQLKQVIYIAVARAAQSNAPGDKKMKDALAEIKRSGVKALLDETESTLRAKIEQAKIDLKI